jgi:iron-sulfur cluster assembly protein
MSTEVQGSSAEDEVIVTQAAAEQALALMDQESMDPDEGGLRLFVQQGGCAGLSYGMRFDNEPESGDKITEHNGLRVFVDQASLKYMDGSVVDFESGLQAQGFHVENPNVVSECGCGESFRT